MSAKHIQTDGTIVEVAPANGTDFSVIELRGFVGGHLELFYPQSVAGALLVINADGKPENLAVTSWPHRCGAPSPSREITSWGTRCCVTQAKSNELTKSSA